MQTNFLPKRSASLLKATLILAALTITNNALAQNNTSTPTYALMGTTANPATSYKVPFNNTDTLFERMQIIYTPAQLKAVSGGTKAPSGSISRVYLRTTATAANFTLKDVIIKLTQTTDTVFKAKSPSSPDVPFYTCSEVFNKKTYAVSTPGWIAFDLSAGFKYDNTKSLVVEVSGDNGFNTTITQQGNFKTNYGKLKAANGNFGFAMHELGFDFGTVTSISDVDATNAINVYPNPANNNVQIIATEDMTGTLVVTDINGRILLQETVAGKQHNFSVATLSNGLYFYKVINTEHIQITTGKLTVAH